MSKPAINHPPLNTAPTTEQALRQLAMPVRKQIYLAWGLSMVATTVLIAQSWLLSMLFGDWLLAYFAQQPLSLDTFYQVLPWLFLCVLLRPLCQFFREHIAFNAGLAVAAKLRVRLMTCIERLGTQRHFFGNDGSLTSQILEQPDTLIAYISRFYLQRYVVVSTPVLLLIVTAMHSFVAALILLFTAPLVPIFMILIGTATAKKSQAQHQALAQLGGRFLDWLRGMPTLKRLGATAMAEQDIAHAASAYRIRTMSVLKIAFLNTAVLELLSALSIALIAVYLGFGLMGILPWQKNHVPVGYESALFLLLLAPEFYAPLRQLGADYHVKAAAVGAMENLLPILRTQASDDLTTHLSKTHSLDSQDLPIDAYPLNRINTACIHKITTPPSVSFQSVQVIAPLSGRQRLYPVSFSVKAGARLAITGASGSGKSTLLEILLGFCDYDGNIDINGVDFSTLNIDDFRQQIGYLSQQTTLMAASIADNLRLANPHATDEELWQALRDVQLDEQIRHLPEQLATVLGERGSGLSGGQQRRLAIAQLMLQDAPLWLLDEPTEHLDPATASDIHELLLTLTQGKTVLWSTHQPEILTGYADSIGLSSADASSTKISSPTSLPKDLADNTQSAPDNLLARG